MKLFNVIDIETSSYCNRKCATCLRNSWPDRREVSHLFRQSLMPAGIFEQILQECRSLKFDGRICLCHWNEPLLDKRIPQFAKMAAETNDVSLATNGDLLTEELAAKLDGVLRFIIISLYSDAKHTKEWYRSLFKKTAVFVKGQHRVAHYDQRGEPLVDQPCRQTPRRCIVAHNGTYLYCCEDLLGEFKFGKFPHVSLNEYWFGKKHVTMWNTLREPRGRLQYSYCKSCPWVFGRSAAVGTQAAIYVRP